MAYVIAEPCVADFSCLEVCPVEDCIAPSPFTADFETVEQLYIDPSRCSNCEACVEACPVDAIYEEGELPEQWRAYRRINAEYFKAVGA